MENISQINILIVGGCGFWAEQNHYPAILQLKKEGIPVNVVAICDIKDPYKEKNRPNLQQILGVDRSIWIKPFGTTFTELERELNTLISRIKIDIIIVSTNPVHHYAYSKWGIKHKIHILCDKPLVVTKDASSNLESALKIQKQFEELEKMYMAVKRNKKITCSAYL